MQINKPKSSKTKKIVLSIVAIVILATLAYGAFAFANKIWPFQEPSPEQRLESSSLEDSRGNKIDDQPADDKNQQQVNDKKEQNRKKIEENEKNEANRKGRKHVDVVITTYNQDQEGLHVNGYVDGVIESNGTCKLTLTNESGRKIVTTRKSHENAKNTTCGQSTIPTKRLSSGTWTITLSYYSDNAEGVSDANIAPTVKIN